LSKDDDFRRCQVAENTNRLSLAERQLQALPAAPETVAVWMAALANGDGGRKPLVRSSIDQALSAVIMRHRDAVLCLRPQARCSRARVERHQQYQGAEGSRSQRQAAVGQRPAISTERLTDRSVALIVKARVKQLVKLRGKSEAEADELIRLISGHSLRAGYATSAAARNMPAYRIQSHTRHKSAQVVTGYIREADKWTKSRLDGVGTESIAATMRAPPFLVVATTPADCTWRAATA
jgi:hypothetical protein